MIEQLRPAATMLAAMTVLTGVVYPALMTAIAQALFPASANGGLIRRGERVVGSSLIGQSFTRPEYFWGRLSATSPTPFNAAASGGSNFGPLNPALLAAANARIAALCAYQTPDGPIPVDLVTASGSGLDPHISLAAAEFQVPRVATHRGLPQDEVRRLVAKAVESRTLGVLGEPRVHVLRLNLALDDLSSR